ncbi:uncharacterized protein CCOS01_07393 [Colletotrichum costaricense]|uniref:Uncharacterized protein n=1 Tax=Colletotrichum costaricense TaxID=1209916 RepID=A0AAJ0DZZ8_9PEZI|nr:uncharacterized protein CCOS01_07393 [Colletotrichum costaricense]KAK1527131.1 hypothetical protein CCOS01_07393 [Colletotrichum costaricense]
MVLDQPTTIANSMLEQESIGLSHQDQLTAVDKAYMVVVPRSADGETQHSSRVVRQSSFWMGSAGRQAAQPGIVDGENTTRTGHSTERSTPAAPSSAPDTGFWTPLLHRRYPETHSQSVTPPVDCGISFESPTVASRIASVDREHTRTLRAGSSPLSRPSHLPTAP